VHVEVFSSSLKFPVGWGLKRYPRCGALIMAPANTHHNDFLGANFLKSQLPCVCCQRRSPTILPPKKNTCPQTGCPHKREVHQGSCALGVVRADFPITGFWAAGGFFRAGKSSFPLPSYRVFFVFCEVGFFPFQANPRVVPPVDACTRFFPPRPPIFIPDLPPPQLFVSFPPSISCVVVVHPKS